MVATLLISVFVIGFFIFALMMRVIFGKDQEFRGTCASMNPMLVDKGITCGCGKVAGTCDTASKPSSEALPSIGRK